MRSILRGFVFTIGIAATVLHPLAAFASQEKLSEKALLVIDIQEDCTGRAIKPPFLFQKDSKAFISRVNEIITEASSRGVSIVYLRTSFKMQDVAGAQLDSRLKVLGANSILKDSFDAFSSSDHRFSDFLRSQRQIRKLYILGLDATLCVYQTAKAAVENGYWTGILTDAVLTVSGKSKRQLSEMYAAGGINVMTSDMFLRDLRKDHN